jgi:hypothetical protein
MATATTREPVRWRRANLRKPVKASPKSCSSMYDAVASRRSAVRVEQPSMAAAPWRPVVRTEEAAEWSASPVSSRASSRRFPADRPNSSMDSLASLPRSDVVCVNVFRVVKYVPPEHGGGFPVHAPTGRQEHVWLHGERAADRRAAGARTTRLADWPDACLALISECRRVKETIGLLGLICAVAFAQGRADSGELRGGGKSRTSRCSFRACRGRSVPCVRRRTHRR